MIITLGTESSSKVYCTCWLHSLPNSECSQWSENPAFSMRSTVPNGIFRNKSLLVDVDLHIHMHTYVHTHTCTHSHRHTCTLTQAPKERNTEKLKTCTWFFQKKLKQNSSSSRPSRMKRIYSNERTAYLE